ncbi:MAG: M1 family metallopeptidase [Candidatus Bathyarchaeota archaeon]
MQVTLYDLFLDLDFKNLRFEGKVLIELESENDVTLNALGLTILNIKAGGNSLQFKQKGEDLIVKTGSFEGKLEAEYSGLITDIMVGIYRASYDNTYMVTTQFEAAHARRMFPCIDHPGYKAEFKLTVRVDKDLNAISNMPIEWINIEGEKKVVSFKKTPRMSTYLLYLGIDKFEEMKEKFGNIDIIVATTPRNVRKGKFALEIAKNSIDIYQSYFSIPYSLPKIHLIAVPEFAAGAMENWGAITYRENALLIDEDSSFKTKKRVAEIVAHELAHQWFGNLVTMKWWNDLWLNESFATFMGYKTLDTIYPQWKVWQYFLSSETSSALSRDSLKSTHPIEVAIKTPTEIEEIFDEISYSKGAIILRMIEAYVGDENFREGVKGYLTKYRFSNATGRDFWSSLEEASGKQIKKIANDWVSKPGYPLITVMIIGEKLMLRQERFLLSGASEKDVWPLPVTMRINGKLRKILFDREEVAINIKDVKSLKLNSDQKGFCRVNYRGIYNLVWEDEPSAPDRWEIISDALAFLIAGRMPFEEYQSLIKRYYNEQECLPAQEVSDQLSFLSAIMPLKVVELSKKFCSSQLKILSKKTDENSSLLLGIMASRLAIVDESYAVKLGPEFYSYEKVKPDMREAVAIAYARGFSDFEGLIEKYRESSSDEEKVRILNSMVSFRETSLVALSLGLILSGEVKKQNVGNMILAAMRNPDAKNLTWMWIKVNMNILEKLYEGTGSLSRVLQSVIPILGIGKVEEVERFFKENRIPMAEKGIEAGLEKLKIYDRLVKNI